jgi:hypothetical protein
MAPAGSEIGHSNQCWVLAYDGNYDASATNAALGYGFRAGYCCETMGSLSQPAFENYMAAVTGSAALVSPIISTPIESRSKSFISTNVVTNAASGVTATRAILNGNLIDPVSKPPVYLSFEFGLTDCYGSNAVFINKTSSGGFRTTVSNLKPSTTYHYRFKAEGTETLYGDDQTFTTPAARVKVSKNKRK